MCERVLITGASGLLGRAVLAEFERSKDWEALGLAFSRTKGALRKVDITDPQQVTDVINQYKPSVIVHCAAERRSDIVENEQEATKALNVTATEVICQQAALQDVLVVYISTDYVFDGKDPPYSETSEPNPLNKYGQSKLDGEKMTLAANNKNLVLRVPILYGSVEYVEESAVTKLWKNVTDTATQCVVSDYERRYPTHVADVACVIKQLMEKQAQDVSISGIFHWSGEEMMTNYDMSLAMAEIFGISSEHIKGEKKAIGGAKRPYDAHLDSSRIQSIGINVHTPFRQGIKECLQHWAHK